MGIKEHLRKAMVVLLTVAMVSQQSPVVYAVENYSGSSDNESVETYTNDFNENVDENVGSEDEANDQSEDVSDDQSDNENSDQPEGIFDFFGSFFGGVTGQSEEDTLEIEVQFGHSYIEYLDQVIAPPASKFKVPCDTELRFRAYADSGYEILGVSYMADGVKYDLAYDEQTDEYIVESSLLQGTPILVVSAIEASEGELQGLSLHYLDENLLNLNDDLNVDGEDSDSNGFDESVENDNADNESNGTNSLEDVSDGEEVVEGNIDSEKSDSDEEQVEEEEQSDDTAAEKKAAEEDEDEGEAEEPATRTTYEYEDRQVKVVATVEDPEAIPDNAELVVRRVTKNSEGYNYDAYMDALNEASEDMTYDDENTLLYDVAFKVPKTDEDGNVIEGEFVEIQPTEGAVTIEISFKRDQLQDKLEAKEDGDVEIKHLPLVDSVREGVDSTEDATDITSSDINVEDVEMSADVKGETVSLVTDSLSVFAVTVANGGSATIQIKFRDKNNNPATASIESYQHIYAYVRSENWASQLIELTKTANDTYSASFNQLGGWDKLSGDEVLYASFWLANTELNNKDENYLSTTENTTELNNGKVVHEVLPLDNGSAIAGDYIISIPQDSRVSVGSTYTIQATEVPAGTDDFLSILGSSVQFGVLAEYFEVPGDGQTNVAAIKGKSANQTGNDLTNKVEQTYIIAQIDEVFKIKGYSQFENGERATAYFMTPASEANKVVSLGSLYTYIDTSYTYEQLKSRVQDMLEYSSNESELLASRNDNTVLSYRAKDGIYKEDQKYHIDLLGRPAGTYYVTIDNKELYDKTIGAEAHKVWIHKTDDQRIVFNITVPGELDVYKPKINNKTTDDYLVLHDHTVPSSIVYNFTNATKLKINNSLAAIVLAPNATAKVNGTGCGWIQCKNVELLGGEWHNVYQHIEKLRSGSQAVITAKKTIDSVSATNDKSGFKFYLEEKVGNSWSNKKCALNEGDSITFEAIQFDENNFTSTTDTQEHIYRITEEHVKKDINGITYNYYEDPFYAKIVVSKTTERTGEHKEDEITLYSASLPKYYTDEACTQAVSEAVFNNTYQGSSNKEGVFELKGNKVMVGRSFQSGDSWTFTVEAPSETPMPENTSVTINPTTDTNAEFSFGNIVFNESQHKDHTYTYTIKETKSDKNDIVYDESQKIVKLTVSDNGGATLVVTPTDGGGQNVISDLPSYLTFTNTFVEKTSASVSKVWVDGGDQDPLRPTSVTVKLKANGADVSPAKTVDLNGNNNWSHTENNLPKKDADGNEIAYTWVEEGVPSSYQMTSNTVDGHTTITNTELTDATVVKKWNDANNGNHNRPGSVTVELKANGKDIDGMQPVTLNAGNSWTHTVENLPKYDNNGLIDYTWVETSNIAGYTTPTVTKSGATTTITNSEEKTSLTVVKKWNDDGDPDHMRPINLTVNLMKGNTVAGTVTLNEDNNWRGTVNNLPVYENGQKIAYTWVEDKTKVHPTYQEEAPVIDNETNTTTLTNTYTREYTSATVHKVWQDGNDRRKLRPASLTVKLMNGEDVAGTVTLSASNNWTDALDNLPKYAYGELINYQWQEASLPEGYTLTSTAHDENDPTITTLTNTYNAEETELTVKKVWNDGNNQDGIRPESITVKLLENGKDSGKSVILSEDNKWEAKLSDLPVKKGGQTITYSWSEVGLPEDGSYSLTTSTAGTITTLTNTHMPETVELSVKKEWEDTNNQDGIRPKSVTVNLEKLENGEYKTVNTITLSDGNEWQGTVTGLPKKANGVEIKYRWVEVVPNGYGATYTTAEGEPNTTIVTNTHDVEKTSVSVKKVWNDGNNQDGIRPASITAVLLADGVETNESITLNEANDWQGTIDKLDVYKDGKAIAYSFKEVAIQVDRPGQSYRSVITDDGEGNFTITNSHTPETISTSVLKKWTDDNNRDGKRPASITVKLKGGDFENEYVLNEDNNWFMTVTNLPKYANGAAITYEWTEVTSFTDYTAKEPQVNQDFTILGNTFANTTILENTHTSETTEATVVKEWNDGNNQDGKRTDSVTVKLQANDKDVDGQDPVVLSEDNDWRATITNLPKYADGAEIAYTWVEDPVPADYNPSVSIVETSHTTTITNTHTPELTSATVMKKWSDSKNQDGVRPKSIKVKLQADGKDIKTVELKGDSWTHIENDLPKYADGNEIEYKWVEVQEQEDWAKNYELTNTLVEGTVTTFTNKHEAKTQSTVKKVWDDKNNQDKVRPVSIDVTLYANGKATETVATLSETNGWTYTKTDLDKYKDRSGIVYTWVEDGKASEKGYALVQDKTGVSENDPTLYTITNQRVTDKTEATIKKVWNDENNQDGKRPESLAVTLKDGDKEVGKVTLSDANNWTGTVTGLEKNRDGSLIAYDWVEDKLPEGYTLTNTSVAGTVTTITNSYNTKKTSATVKKVWHDNNNQDGIRPETLTVKLLADGKDTGKSVILTKAKNWTDTISNLDAYKSGQLITYTWSEEGLPKGYTLGNPSVNGTITTLTNTHTPDETSVSISKVWDDNNNNDNMRPESITVDLMDGKSKVGSVVLTEADDWHGEVTGLPKYRGGDPITYTWDETKIDGYTGEFSKDENGNPVLTNKHEAETTDVSVTKVWNDKNDQDGKRPSAVIVTLLANDEPLAGKTYELNAGNNWTAEEKGLPKYLNKELISYTWREDKVDYYTLDGYVTKKGVTTLTNTHTPETISLSVEKIFEDNNNQDGIRPESVVVNLLANGKVVATETLNSENEWKASETNLPKYDDGKEIVYVWEEVVPDGYTASYDKESDASPTTVVTNTHKTEETSISVQKVWDDDSNRDGIRPSSITVNLLADGAFKKSITLSATNNWHEKVEHLAAKHNGNAIVYSIEEVTVDGYDSEISKEISNDGKVNFTITNTHKIAETEATVTKAWDDSENQDGKRPAKLEVTLKGNGNSVDSVTLTAENNWTAKLDHLPVYDNGSKIVYAWTEGDMPEGYALKSSDTVGTVTTITNTYDTDTTSASVHKEWDDANNQDGIRPASLTVKLLADGKDTGKTVTLNNANGWTGSITGLDKFRDNGVEIVYTWKEPQVEGYNKATAAKSDNSMVLTNTHTTDETTATVQKVWEDDNDNDGKRPESVTVNLMDGTTVKETVVLSEANNWTYTVENLEKNRAGKPVKYTWEEVNLPDGYKLISNNTVGTITTLTNEHKNEMTEATIKKVWDDSENQDGKRPGEIVAVLSNGTEVTLNATNHWTYTVTDLPKYENGDEIKYTWSEKAVPDGYTLTGNSTQGTITTLTNAHETEKKNLSIQKVWEDNNNQDGIRPAEITVALLANGKGTEHSVTLNSANDWKATVQGLDVYAGGSEIAYAWSETGLPEGYKLSDPVTDGNLTTLTNTHKTEETSVSVQKVWDDNNDQDGVRPESITVKLLADGVEKELITLDASNDWYKKIEHLDAKRDEGQAIAYTFEEVKVDGYKTETKDDGKGNFTITNTHVTEKTDLTIKKEWHDNNNQDGARPTELQVTLTADGEVRETITLNEENKWTATVKDLPVYNGGEKIEYAWSEDNAALASKEYTLTRTDVSADDTETTLHNTYKAKETSVTVTKVWNDDDNRDGSRPESLTVKLQADGEDTGKSVTLNADNDWTATLDKLDAYKSGQLITYTWKEVDLPEGYKLDNTSVNGTVTTITNIHESAKTEAKVVKVWNDDDNNDGKRPASITVKLLADGKETGDTAVLNKANEWTATIDGLDAKKDGKDIKYTWSENEEGLPEGYALESNETKGTVTTITNKYENETTEASVIKVWDDNNDQDKIRPDSLTVVLSEGTEVVLNEQNGWTGKVESLPKFKDGKEIEYTWTEKDLPEGYRLTNTSKEGTVTTLTNTHGAEETSVTVKKVWDDDNNRDGLRPTSITLTLNTGDAVTLNAENNWTATISGLPKYSNGKLISYSWVEKTVPVGYTVTGNVTDGMVTTITNKHVSDVTKTSVKKVWNDNDNQDGLRPASLTVTLLADGKNYQDVTLDQSNGWSAELNNLPKFDKGVLIDYKWSEPQVDNYSAETKVDASTNAWTFTNTLVTYTTKASVHKVWDDKNDQDKARPATLSVDLRANGETVRTVTLSAPDWSATVDDLPLNADGQKITYAWAEGSMPEGYQLTSEGADPNDANVTVITNTYDTETTSATVKKVWEDEGDKEGIRPDELTVTLVANNVPTETTVVLSNENGWQGSVSGLDKFADGKEITYTWTEGALPEGYELTDTSVEGTVTTLTNTHVVEETEATIKKVWDDAENQDGIRPATLSVALSNGTIVNLSEANQWTATVEHLPKYADDKEITYTWTEDALPEGYELTDTSVEGTVTTLTNSHKAELTEATVKKIWNDHNNRDGLRPESLDVTLSNGAKVTLNEENDWTATVKNLPKYANGTEIEYTWTEGDMPEGYELTDTTVNGTVTTLTNTHEAATTEATIVKVWNDSDNQDGIRPSELTVTLSNGMPVVLSARNDWSATIVGLPKYDNGTEIEYTWTEGALPAGYTLSGTNVNGTVTTLTNTHVAEMTEATVRKVWDDKDNQDGIRPAALTVTLSNGNTVTLNEANNWTATISDLPKYDNGTEIEYTWTESNLPDGYELSDTSVNGTVTTLTNTHETEVTEASVKKVWNDGDNKDGKRPESLTVTLSNGTEVTLNEENEWTATVNDLPMYADGEKVVYAWTEGEMPAGYTLTDTSVDGTVTTLTNSYDTEETSATITKVWAGDEGLNVRPNNLMATLSNGIVVVLNAANNWTATVSNLPAYEAGELITYTWSEGDTPQGYELTDTSVNGTITTLTNTYKGKDSVTLNGTKKIEGREFVEGDEFTFTVTAEEGTPMPKDTTVTITPTAGNEYAVDFGEITYTLADAGKTYTYTITETGEVEGVTNDEPQTVTVTIVDNGDGTITAQRDADTASFTFTNTYAAAGTLELSGKKFMDGRELTEDDVFEFTVTDEDGNVTTVSNEGEAIAYKPIAYTIEDLGTHTYTIAETAYDKDGVKSDTNVYVLTVEVTDNHDGTLSAFTSGADAGNLDFTNTYTATADAEIKAHKTLTGRKLEADQFKFALAGEGIEDQTKTNDADGNVAFDKITYTAADLADAEMVEGVRTKSFEYTIIEVDGGQDGYSYDAATQNVTVTVNDDMKGNMTATVAYADDREIPEFLNTYRAADTNAVLEAHKVLEGNGLRQLADREFTFDLMDEEGEVIATAYNDADGNVAFAPISYNYDTFVDENGVFVGKTFSYTIAERKGDETGITYDENTYKATVTVSDDGKGQLVAAVAYELGEAPTFTNTYVGSSTTITFDKYYFGSNENAAFDFIITAADEKGEPRVNADGTSVEHTGDAEIVDEGQAFTIRFKNGAFADSLAEVTSPEISYAKAGTYYYTLTEADHEDPITYLITVKVANNGSVVKTYQMLDGEDNEAVETMEFFNNEAELLTFRSMSMGAMGAPQHVASVMPKVGKVFENGKLEDGKFTFRLMDEDKKNVLQEATNAADGEVKFDRITYTAPGTYKYVIVEKEGKDKTVVYDDTEINYTVTVAEDADGELLVSEQYSVDEKVTEDPTFTNKARTIIIRARKKSREAPYDPLNGSTYGIWMANPDGNDVYMGSDISHIDLKIEGDTGGWLDYNVPTTPGVAYYLLEEAAPHGHLVDPYPTDYFTIASNEDGYYLVYQSDPKFFELVPDLKGKI